MNLNHIFLFLAVISPLLVLARAWQPGSIYRGWRIAAFVVLVITGAAWIFFRFAAGYIAGGAWFAFLFLPAIGLRKVTELAARQHYRSARKLAAVLQILHPSAELREQVQLFRHLESHQNDRAGVASFPIHHEIAEKDRHRYFRNAPAVFILILLNAAAFIFEISFGNWTDPEVLHQLGALEPYAVVVQGQYWRLFTALFLHAGFVHLLFNLFALYVLGPPLERSIGALRFAICYLISGLISSAGVVALTVIGIVQVAQLVGASGCIMGIVGAWAGFLLRHRHAPHAKQRLGNVLMIVAIQTAFDLSTPQVSMAAHLCGLFSGAVLGFVLAPRTVK
ncbi:MAG TPA: rhomboid family intramembrane serine protease [Candidatus Binatus sp.]|nr:rhomboid family intramembrane serine protease [Candidatus Binatus sp.]